RRGVLQVIQERHRVVVGTERGDRERDGREAGRGAVGGRLGHGGGGRAVGGRGRVRRSGGRSGGRRHDDRRGHGRCDRGEGDRVGGGDPVQLPQVLRERGVRRDLRLDR